MFDASPQYTCPGTPSGLRERREPPVMCFEGRMLGGFHMAREIACGGMGRVFLAHRTQHAGVGQPAAVKVIHPHLAHEDEFINMFLDEARIASSLSHPNVCRVLDFGMADGTYYLAMDFVVGESLADVITRLRHAPDAEWIAEPLMRYVGHQVCEALHAVHEAQDIEGAPLDIVHRDVSPQNIMIGYDGSVRLLDFGVARAAERLQITRVGVIKGRLAYMAPEQMRAGVVDRRADLWSLGVILWEGLTGRRLFRRDNEVQTVLAVTVEDVPPPTHHERPIPLALQRVVERALQRDPARRYANARAFGIDLMRCKGTFPLATISDVSEWMQALFADSITQKRNLLGDAARAAQAAQALRRIPEVHTATYGDDVDDEAETSLAIPIPSELRRRPTTAVETPSVPRAPTASASGTLCPVELEALPEAASRGWLGRGTTGALLLAVMVLLVGAPGGCSSPTALVRDAKAAFHIEQADAFSMASLLLPNTKQLAAESLLISGPTSRAANTIVTASAGDACARVATSPGDGLGLPSITELTNTSAAQPASVTEPASAAQDLVHPSTLDLTAQLSPRDAQVPYPRILLRQAGQSRRLTNKKLVRAKRGLLPQREGRGRELIPDDRMGRSVAESEDGAAVSDGDGLDSPW